MKKKIFLLILTITLTFCPVLAKDKIEVLNKDNGVYIFKIDTKKYGDKIKPFIAPKLTTPKKVYDDNCFDLVVNAGFFDVKNGKTVSYITINNKLVGDVKKHPELIKSLENEQRLDKVLSRGELRILEKNNKLKFDIVSHNAPIDKGYAIKHALQAGPILYPDMDLEGEGFVKYEDGVVKFQSVDILKRRERTAIGLRGKWLYIVLFTKDYKVDANEMRDYMKDKLKLKKILAFDGGLSTSVNYKDIQVGSLGKYQRRVKSFLVIER
ncbi:MAG: phosphodiester glycosidase family protein [Candidatus Gastranaerophilales bacterium]|nr:phosphodiester glycosidase family protein [Candidatus Gastranaerophilales bacterium]